MKTLVTGAGGFVGGYLIDALVSGGHEVVLTSTEPLRTTHRSEVLDIRDSTRFKEVVSAHEPDAVIHLAAQPSVPKSWEDPANTYETNIIGTSNLLEAVKDRTTTRVLLVGSGQQYRRLDEERPFSEDDPLEAASPYALSKVAQEQMGRLYHREFGLHVMIARAFNHMGPGQGPHYAIGAFCSKVVAIERGQADPHLVVGYLGSRRDVLDVRDVVKAYLTLIEKGTAGEAYNVCTGDGRSIGELLDILVGLARVDGEVKITSDPDPRPGDPTYSVGDPSKMAALGWKAAIPIEKSLADTLDWYRSLPSDQDEQENR